MKSKKGKIRFDNELLRETLSWIDTLDNDNNNDNITTDDVNINDLDLMIAPIWSIPPQRPSRTVSYVDSLIERTNKTITSYLFRSDDNDSDNENNTIKNITKRMILRMRLSIKKWMKYNLIQIYQKEALIKGNNIYNNNNLTMILILYYTILYYTIL